MQLTIDRKKHDAVRQSKLKTNWLPVTIRKIVHNATKDLRIYQKL